MHSFSAQQAASHSNVLSLAPSLLFLSGPTTKINGFGHIISIKNTMKVRENKVPSPKH